MANNGIPKRYRFVDNDDRTLCEVIAVTYDEAYEKAVAKAGNGMPFRADFFIETLERDERIVKRKKPRKHSLFTAIKGTSLLTYFFSKNG